MLRFKADGSEIEGSVIFDTAVAITQGIWPATKASNTTLADGTTVISPLNGYQYVPSECGHYYRMS